VIIFLSFITYLAGASYGITYIEVGNAWKILVPYEDPYVEFTDSLEKHYLAYPYPIQAWML
jgi:hypothetical protein